MKIFWTLLLLLEEATLPAFAFPPERSLVLRFSSDSLTLAHLSFTLTHPDHYRLLEGQSDSLGFWRGELPAPLTDEQVRLLVVSPFYASLDTLLDLSQAEHHIRLQGRETQLDGVQVRGIRRYNRGDALQQVFSFDPRSITRGTTLKAGLRMLPGVIALGESYTLLGKNQQATVQVNGVEASEAELRLLPARAVDRIAIDATGSRGVINIILRQRSYPWGRFPMLRARRSSATKTPIGIPRSRWMAELLASSLPSATPRRQPRQELRGTKISVAVAPPATSGHS